VPHKSVLEGIGSAWPPHAQHPTINSNAGNYPLFLVAAK